MKFRRRFNRRNPQRLINKLTPRKVLVGNHRNREAPVLTVHAIAPDGSVFVSTPNPTVKRLITGESHAIYRLTEARLNRYTTRERSAWNNR